MSEKLNHYFKEMDRLLALDSKYKRPGFTMDMNDYAYLYVLTVYSLLMLKKLGVQVDTHLELPHLMTKKASPYYIYNMAYCDDGEEDEDEDNCMGYNYYAIPWFEMYEPYTGCISKKNVFWELSDFMYRYFLDIKEKNGLGLWTVFSEEDCTELFSSTEVIDKKALIQAAIFFMHSRGSTERLASMGIEFSEKTKKEVSFAIDNTLFINGLFVLTSAKSEKTAAALESRGIQGEHAKGFLEKCRRLDDLLWRPGTTVLAEYTYNNETVTRTQIIGTDADFEISFDYAEISPLLPAYLYYLERAAEEVDSIFFGGRLLMEGTNGQQK